MIVYFVPDSAWYMIVSFVPDSNSGAPAWAS